MRAEWYNPHYPNTYPTHGGAENDYQPPPSDLPAESSPPVEPTLVSPAQAPKDPIEDPPPEPTLEDLFGNLFGGGGPAASQEPIVIPASSQSTMPIVLLFVGLAAVAGFVWYKNRKGKGKA